MRHGVGEFVDCRPRRPRVDRHLEGAVTETGVHHRRVAGGEGEGRHVRALVAGRRRPRRASVRRSVDTVATKNDGRAHRVGHDQDRRPPVRGGEGRQSEPLGGLCLPVIGRVVQRPRATDVRFGDLKVGVRGVDGGAAAIARVDFVPCRRRARRRQVLHRAVVLRAADDLGAVVHLGDSGVELRDVEVGVQVGIDQRLRGEVRRGHLPNPAVVTEVEISGAVKDQGVKVRVKLREGRGAVEADPVGTAVGALDRRHAARDDDVGIEGIDGDGVVVPALVARVIVDVVVGVVDTREIGNAISRGRRAVGQQRPGGAAIRGLVHPDVATVRSDRVEEHGVRRRRVGVDGQFAETWSACRTRGLNGGPGRAIVGAHLHASSTHPGVDRHGTRE